MKLENCRNHTADEIETTITMLGNGADGFCVYTTSNSMLTKIGKLLDVPDTAWSSATLTGFLRVTSSLARLRTAYSLKPKRERAGSLQKRKKKRRRLGSPQADRRKEVKINSTVKIYYSNQ